MNFIADFLGMNEPGYESSTDMIRGQNAGAKKKRGRPKKVGRPKKKKVKSKKGGGVAHGRHAYGMNHASVIKRFPKGGSCCSNGTCHQTGRGVAHGRHAYGMKHADAIKRFPQKGGLGIKGIKKLQNKLVKLHKELEKAKARKRIMIRKQIKATETVLKRLIGGAKKKRGRPRKVGRPKGPKKVKRKRKVNANGYYSI